MEKRLIAELAKQQHQSQEDQTWLQQEEINLVMNIYKIESCSKKHGKQYSFYKFLEKTVVIDHSGSNSRNAIIHN